MTFHLASSVADVLAAALADGQAGTDAGGTRSDEPAAAGGGLPAAA
jgi:hypothetical protein